MDLWQTGHQLAPMLITQSWDSSAPDKIQCKDSYWPQFLVSSPLSSWSRWWSDFTHVTALSSSISSSSVATVNADIEEEDDVVDTFRDSNPEDAVDVESRLLLRSFLKSLMVDKCNPPVLCCYGEIHNTEGVSVHDEADLDRVVRWHSQAAEHCFIGCSL